MQDTQPRTSRGWRSGPHRTLSTASILPSLRALNVFSETAVTHNRSTTSDFTMFCRRLPLQALFNKQRITFLGHIIDNRGISQDPKKTAAVSTTIEELRRFLGMVNQLSRFTPNIAEITQPLSSTKKAWTWGPAQEEAFSKLKEERSHLC